MCLPGLFLSNVHNFNLYWTIDSEFWEVRNKAMIALKNLVTQVEDAPNVTDIISLQVFRLLKDPLKNMVSFAL